MQNYIKGNYRKSIFHSEKGYVIGLFKVRDTNIETMKDYINKTITFTGYFHELNEDDTYLFYGEEINHPRYGFQFQVVEYERVKPEDKEGIVEFLSSDLFPGVGEKLAQTIVDILGETTLEQILEDDSCLNLVPKLTVKKANLIVSNLKKYEESHKTIVYLTELGFNMKDSLAIYNTYYRNTIAKIENDIFSLSDDLKELSFLKLDEISKKLNMDPFDERRLKACIIYCITTLTFQNGDTYLLKEEIYQAVLKYLKQELSLETFDELLEQLELETKIVIDQEHYYLQETYTAEKNIIIKMISLLKKGQTKYKKLDNLLEALEQHFALSYNEKQKLAIKKSLQENILIITGGPGTGKTTIIKAIVQLYQDLNNLDYDELVEQIALLAPTGRAAKRMSESTQLPASTIHRFLHWNQEANQFAVNEYNKDNRKFIIIDEVSMIDLSLFDSLLKGLTDNIQLILVGDYNQLPSVGPGQVLKDLIDSNTIDTIHLDQLYRQDENSYITTLAHEIKNNDLSENFLDTRSDYTFLECSGMYLRPNLKKLCQQILDKGYDYRKVQLMAPMYRGENGIDNLNMELQSVFNPQTEDSKEITYGDVIFREHDKILQLVNMPEENVYNGDLGIIENIILASESTSGKNEIYVNFDGNIVKYLPKDFIKIKHGYIISIHKAQGSEFEIVILPICKSYSRMLYRKLIYTAVTRAKKKLILIGEAEAFVYSIKNDREIPRKTNMCQKLIDIMNSLQ